MQKLFKSLRKVQIYFVYENKNESCNQNEINITDIILFFFIKVKH